MALFYLIAKKAGDFEWGHIYSKIDTFRHECITVFPISKWIGTPTNAIGITANGKFRNQINIVVRELTQLLELLWQTDFEIYDLHKGRLITKSTFKDVMNYL
jgi:hypothetical protein